MLLLINNMKKGRGLHMKKDKMLKTVLVSTTTCMLAGLVLAGCSSDSSAPSVSVSPTAGASGDQGTQSGAPITLSVAENGAALPAPDADFIKQELESRLNIKLNLAVNTSLPEYTNQLNVRIAGGDAPDMFQVPDRAQLGKLAAQEQLLDLTPYLDKLGNVKKFLGEDNLKKGYYNGKLYAIPKMPQIDYWTYWVRKDWLDKLKLSVPTTVDELLAVAKAFTENDPDGNNKKDTFGLSGGGGGGAPVFNFNSGFGSAFAPVFGAYGVGVPGSIYAKDGKLMDAFHDPAMPDALQMISQFINDKVIDPDLPANDGLQHQQKAIQGQVGIVYIDWANISKDQFATQIKEVNPNAEWVQIAAPKGPAGQLDGTWDIGSTPMLFGLSKSLEKDPAKLQKLLDLLNYVADGDGSTLVQYGIKDRHYTLENGKPKPTDLLAKEGGYIYDYQFVGRPELEYLQGRFAKQASFIDFTNKQPRLKALNGFVDIPQGFVKADADRYGTEELLKFLYGKRPMSEYNDFLNTLDTKFNYKAYTEAASAQLTALGLLK